MFWLGYLVAKELPLLKKTIKELDVALDPFWLEADQKTSAPVIVVGRVLNDVRSQYMHWCIIVDVT